MATKTLYHSELVGLGPVRVTVESDVLNSKYPNKPPYVTLTLNGEKRNYTTENENCEAFFRGQKGRQFTIIAEGSREAAVITYVGEAAPATTAQRPPTPPPAPTAPPPRTTTSAPAMPPQRGAMPPPAAKGEWKPLGATVGMAMNNACASLTAQGLPLETKAVHQLASDLLRVARYLENGHLAPKESERQGTAAPVAAPAPVAPPVATQPMVAPPAATTAQEPQEDPMDDVPF